MARFEHPHDRQMRSVPDRPGLIQRLRDVAVADEALDEWLGEVPLPCDFVANLQRAVFDEPCLDEMLRDAPVPGNLVADIRQSVLDDACLDEMLCQAPAPNGLVTRLQSVCDSSETPRDAEQSTAQSTAPTVELANVSPATSVGRDSHWRRRWSNAAWGTAVALLLIAMQWGAVYRLAASLVPKANDSSTELVVADWGPLDMAVSMADHLEETLVVMESFEPVDDAPASDVMNVELQQWELPPRSVFQQLTSEVSAGLDLNLDVWSTRIEHVGYPARESLRPEALDQVRQSQVILPGLPRSRAYDRAFHWRHGVSPWVSAKAISTQPLSLHSRPDRFDRLLLQSTRSTAIAPAEVAVEDALATMDPRWPMPSDGQIALRTAGGPSVFGEPDAALLQIGVAAGAPANRLLSPARLTLLLDASAEVSANDFLVMQRQIAAALRMLRPEDLLTIITIGGEPKVLCEDVGPEQLEAVRTILSEYPRRGIADWGRAIPRAVQAALEGQQATMRQELLLVTSGRGEWADSAEQWMDRAMEEAGRWGVEVALCGTDSYLVDRVRDWAERHQLTWTAGTQGIQRAVCEALAGTSQNVGLAGPSAMIAQDVRLTIQFNPQAVAAYRVLGQDATAAQWTDDPTPVEMLAGDQSNALVEIRWAGDDDDVGWVTLSWKDMDGRSQQRRQRVSRIQFAPSFQQSPASLQSAVLAAEAAQILMESPFARGRGHKMSNVLDLYWECDARVRARPELLRLIQSIEHSSAGGASEP